MEQDLGDKDEEEKATHTWWVKIVEAMEAKYVAIGDGIGEGIGEQIEMACANLGKWYMDLVNIGSLNSSSTLQAFHWLVWLSISQNMIIMMVEGREIIVLIRSGYCVIQYVVK